MSVSDNNNNNKIIHLVWLNLGKGDLPYGKYLEGYNAWIQHNPNCKIILWNSKMINELLDDEHYQFFRSSWNKIDKMLIQRLDIIRPIILHKYGGIYGDLDLICKRSVEPLFDTYLNPDLNGNDKIILMKSHLIGLFGRPTNSFYLGRAAHPFWMFYIKLAEHKINNWKWARDDSFITIMCMTGPALLHEAVSKYKHKYKHVDGSGSNDSNDSSIIEILHPKYLFSKPDEYIDGVSYGYDRLAGGYGGKTAFSKDVLRILFIALLIIALFVGLFKIFTSSKKNNVHYII
jgi:mannosyltransferase OCH1-like enzyme